MHPCALFFDKNFLRILLATFFYKLFWQKNNFEWSSWRLRLRQINFFLEIPKQIWDRALKNRWAFNSSPLQIVHHGSWWYFTSVKPTSSLVLVFPHPCHTSSYILLVFPHLPLKSTQYWEKSLYSTVHHMVSQVSEFWVSVNQTMSPYTRHYKPRLVYFSPQYIYQDSKLIAPVLWFLHNGEVHHNYCGTCKDNLDKKPGDLCPLCDSPIDLVVKMSWFISFQA